MKYILALKTLQDVTRYHDAITFTFEPHSIPKANPPVKSRELYLEAVGPNNIFPLIFSSHNIFTKGRNPFPTAERKIYHRAADKAKLH